MARDNNKEYAEVPMDAFREVMMGACAEWQLRLADLVPSRLSNYHNGIVKCYATMELPSEKGEGRRVAAIKDKLYLFEDGHFINELGQKHRVGAMDGASWFYPLPALEVTSTEYDELQPVMDAFIHKLNNDGVYVDGLDLRVVGKDEETMLVLVADNMPNAYLWKDGEWYPDLNDTLDNLREYYPSDLIIKSLT